MENVYDVEMGPANQTLSVKDVRHRAHEDQPDEIRLAMAAGLFEDALEASAEGSDAQTKLSCCRLEAQPINQGLRETRLRLRQSKERADFTL